MRRRIHPIRHKHKEAQILIHQDGFGLRSIDAHAGDFVFKGWSENIQRGYAGFEWQSQEFILAGRVIDFREIVWRVRKCVLRNAESGAAACSKGGEAEDQAKSRS